MPTYNRSMNGRAFRKMHGLGNDFVVIDGRQLPCTPSNVSVRLIADRKRGVGCDQLIVIEPGGDGADAFMRIYNADGSEAEACGNATRCVASLLFAESGADRVVIRTLAGLLPATPAEAGFVTVDMGPARLAWQEVPLAREADTLSLDLSLGPLSSPVALSMGNPHVVFFVDDADAVPLAELGPQIETHPLFPQRTNVQIVQVLSHDHLKQRIWERGVGLTESSGSSACAAVVAGVRRGLTRHRTTVEQPGGKLEMEWRESDGHVLMSGPVATAFTGELDPTLL